MVLVSPLPAVSFFPSITNAYLQIHSDIPMNTAVSAHTLCSGQMAKLHSLSYVREHLNIRYSQGTVSIMARASMYQRNAVVCD